MQHIHRIYNLLSPEFCQYIIDVFEKSELKHQGVSYSAKDDGTVEKIIDSSKKSTDISIFPGFVEKAISKDEPIWEEVVTNINIKLQKALDEYITIFPQLDTLQKFELEAYNIQRYLPGEGFFKWHSENAGYNEGSERMLAFMIYLNDVDDGGTEFLDQNHTEKAEVGKYLVWPAYWTHTHKGQISYTKTKYIITGWYRHVLN